MPVDFITATKQDLELEQQGLRHNLEKQEAYTPAQQVTKDLTRSLLSVKIDLENSYRFIKDCELPNTHTQKKQEFLAQINKAILETTSAYQTGYITLTHGAELAQEFLAADLSSAGLTTEQSKKVRDLAKKREEDKDKEDKRNYTNKASSSFKKNSSYFPYQKQLNNFSTFSNDSFPATFPGPYPGLTYPRTTFAPAYPIQPNPTLFPPPAMPAITYNPNQTATAFNNPNKTNQDRKLQIDKEKEVTNCHDCGALGHWVGDRTCPKQLARLAGYAMYPYSH